MTLSVGILCSDGAVIAADKQTTHGSLGLQTVGKNSTKITMIRDRALVASTGHRGLSQQFCHAIEQNVEGFVRQNVGDAIFITIQRKFRELIEPAFSVANKATPFLGQVAQLDVICGSLVAAKFKDGVSVIEVTPLGATERLSSDVPFICLGSGKQNADPFLAYLWSVYFENSTPTLSEGVLMAYWTIETAIRLKTSGVGYGSDVFVIDANASRIGRQLQEDEFHEHNAFIQEAESALRSVREKLRGDSTGGVASPPTLSETGKRH
jgi:20S proteasome alpha/beta subunit